MSIAKSSVSKRVMWLLSRAWYCTIALRLTRGHRTGSPKLKLLPNYQYIVLKSASKAAFVITFECQKAL